MSKTNKKMEKKECFFSIELKSKQTLKNITLNDASQENVLIEGSIGKLNVADFVSEDIMEFVGSQGVLRVNVSKQEISEVKQQ